MGMVYLDSLVVLNCCKPEVWVVERLAHHASQLGGAAGLAVHEAEKTLPQ